VGRNNILGGHVTTVVNNFAHFETDCGSFSLKVPEDNSVEVGQSIQISIAADRLRLQPASEATDKSKVVDTNPSDFTINQVDCTLISEEFVGAVVTLFFESKDGTELMVQVQERELDQLSISQDTLYTLSWSSDAAHLLND